MLKNSKIWKHYVDETKSRQIPSFNAWLGEHSAKWGVSKIIYHNTKARDYIAEMSLNRIMHVFKKKKKKSGSGEKTNHF